jgi:hypothetical protein
LYASAAARFGYDAKGLESTVSRTPVLCGSCHSTNALGLAGFAGIPSLTSAVHTMHASVVDPATNQAMDSELTRDACYRCHPGPKTQCLRGAMGTLKTGTGDYAIQCQSCHGTLSAVGNPARQGWLQEPECQNCHIGSATQNGGTVIFTSAWNGATLRPAVDDTFATNADTPSAGLSLYRFSKGHGGLQCEACHGSTHAEYATAIANDNVQSNALQGHSGTIAACEACHGAAPNTVSGGPHGLHPIGQTWVRSHEEHAQNPAACQGCHGLDYRGTALSKTLADRSFGTRSFPRGTIIGCYSCHNGPRGE